MLSLFLVWQKFPQILSLEDAFEGWQTMYQGSPLGCNVGKTLLTPGGNCSPPLWEACQGSPSLICRLYPKVSAVLHPTTEPCDRVLGPAAHPCPLRLSSTSQLTLSLLLWPLKTLPMILITHKIKSKVISAYEPLIWPCSAGLTKLILGPRPPRWPPSSLSNVPSWALYTCYSFCLEDFLQPSLFHPT